MYVWIVECYGTFDSVWSTEQKAKTHCEWGNRQEGEDSHDWTKIKLNNKNEEDHSNFFNEE